MKYDRQPLPRQNSSDVAVSVIVPFFNRSDLLGHCLTSIACAIDEYCEVILIDDGSTDGSSEVATHWTEGISNARYIRTANRGVASARNTGIDAAAGEYLFFVDSDDLISPNAISLLLAKARQTGAQIISGARANFSSELDKSVDANISAACTELSALQLIQKGIGAPARLFNRRLFTDYPERFPDGMWAEDAAYVPFLASVAIGIVYIDSVIYHIRKGDGQNLTASKRTYIDLPRAIQLLSFRVSCDRLFSYVAGVSLNEYLHYAANSLEVNNREFRQFMRCPEFGEIVRIFSDRFSLSYLFDVNPKRRPYILAIFVAGRGCDPILWVFARRRLGRMLEFSLSNRV